MATYKIIQNYLTHNDCYRKGATRNVTLGVIRHSTGCNNPNLRRYVVNEALFGKSGTNHWDKPGISKCVHFMIGKDKDGKVQIVQTLPLNYKCWGCGSGSKGSDNNSHIQYEILEDGHTDGKYYKDCMDAADWLDAYLCKKYNLTEKKVISHHEAHLTGYATDHSDPHPWMKVFGDSMDKARARVALLLRPATTPTPAPTPTKVVVEEKYELAKDKNPAIAGTYEVIAKTSLNIRRGPGVDKVTLGTLPKGTKVRSYGFYTDMGTIRWHLVVASVNGKEVTGYVSGTYIRKI